MHVWVVIHRDDYPLGVYSTEEAAEALAQHEAAECYASMPDFGPDYGRPAVISYEVDAAPSAEV